MIGRRVEIGLPARRGGRPVRRREKSGGPFGLGIDHAQATALEAQVETALGGEAEAGPGSGVELREDVPRQDADLAVHRGDDPIALPDDVTAREPASGAVRTLHVHLACHGDDLADVGPGGTRTEGERQRKRAATPPNTAIRRYRFILHRMSVYPPRLWNSSVK